ncbi:hypothetical protein MKK69_17880 [Methylobacterium sp. J-026]|uniref:hypothetical protein n=1 Tax=Methylobacterium sp. J-026 TaxID=2836624 RepID=UPI001FB8B2EE|nr:hypothetical protein [Methylobacterium sp. J-026]MCJ2135899.1 hypothetical protein [Methylobacterium sp. J-026]
MAASKSTPARRTRAPHSAARIHAAVLEEAKRSGLLDGVESEHVSFRVPSALVNAAKREAGITSTAELGVVALALLAQPDPVANFLRCTAGRLGPDHDLDTGTR